jgi:5'-nucleotidase
VVQGSVSVGGAPLQPDGTYSLATKAYLAEGRDGYDALLGAKLVQDSDCTPLLPTVIANHFLLLRTLNRAVAATGRRPAWQRAAELLLNSSDLYSEKSQQRLKEEGTSHTSRRHPLKGRWEIAPVVDGRICIVGSSTAGGK